MNINFLTAAEDYCQATNKKKRKVPSTTQSTTKPTFTFEPTTNNNLDLLPTTQDVSSDSLLDPLALAKILSSHHIRMRKRPISSPRHYGRHLHKLSQSRPSIDQQQFDQTPKLPTTDPPQPKKTNKRSVNPNNLNLKSPASQPQPSKFASPNKLPILPNLYDPSLPIEQTYAHYSPPHSLDIPKTQSLAQTVILENHQPQDGICFPPSDYDGQFTFRLEMHQVCQRLAGLHLAISTDKKNRAIQIQEAMRIAMERLDQTAAPEAFPSDQTNFIHQEDHNRTAKVDPARQPASQTLSSIRPPVIDQQTPPPDCHRRSPQSPTSATDHGPSGPPPTEPPPPLPQPPVKSSGASDPIGGAQISVDPDVRPGQGPRKNKKKGKKKRSAHANANNIHHRDNYVPSRLPTSYPVRPGTRRGFEDDGMPRDWARVRLEYEARLGRGFIDPTTAGPDEPGPEALLSGTGRNTHCQLGRSPIARFFVEPDEWICSFCEYELWFGDPLGLLRVIKNRKDVLRRRRRAKERAARAASGVSPSSHPAPPPLPPAPPAPLNQTAPPSTENTKIYKKSKNNFPSQPYAHSRPPTHQQQTVKPSSTSPPPHLRQTDDIEEQEDGSIPDSSRPAHVAHPPLCLKSPPDKLAQIPPSSSSTYTPSLLPKSSPSSSSSSSSTQSYSSQAKDHSSFFT